MHDIGKNLVSIMLRGAGYEVVDIGIGCSAEQFRDAIQEHKPDIAGMSALLTTTMAYMKTVIDFLRQDGVTVPVIVGGAAVNAVFAKQIGAQGYAKNAAEAVDLVCSLLEGTAR